MQMATFILRHSCTLLGRLKNISALDVLWESILLSRVNPCLLQGEMCDRGGIELLQSTKAYGVKITGMASTKGAHLVAGC